MKLKCTKHDRRVVAGTMGFLHRSTVKGDHGARCDSATAKIGTVVFDRSEWEKAAE